MCHSNRGLSMKKQGRTVSLFVDESHVKGSVHSAFSCVTCHVGFSATEIPHAKNIQPVACQNCHPIEGFDKSIHGTLKNNMPLAGCSSCHGKHDIKPVNDAKSVVARSNVAGTCGECHREEHRQFTMSAHGNAVANGSGKAPSCVDCHGSHTIESTAGKDPLALKMAEGKLCLKCHLNDPEIRAHVGYSAGFIAAYEKSVHGEALAAGNSKSAVCGDCHGLHDQKKASDPGSWVNRWNIKNTCSRCHQQIAEEYGESIHGKAVAKGKSDSPTCTDCHGEHQIYAADDPRSRVSHQNVSSQVCASCHNSVQLSEKYGIAAGQVATFEDSYHGLALKAGAVEVANCASCHGAHNVKPSSDPTSTVHKSNLAATCGNCHPGANEKFAIGAVHVDITAAGSDKILYWIRIIYIVLIVVTIGSMFLHNLLDFIKKTAHRFAVRKGKIVPQYHGSAEYVRMTLNQRIQHALMFLSFFLLVITGFMLRFPESWWVVPIRSISEDFFAVRSIVHRIAGAVLIGVSVYHLVYIIFTRGGRKFISDMFPRFKDLSDIRVNLLYLLGLSRKRPLFDRFSYIEKAEYWALIWGVVIMSATGIFMWFDNYFMGLLTKLGWDISRTVHYYEAILATLAIVVWHFYFVMLNPNVYPMSTAWITGKLSEEEMAEEHPLELERLKTESTVEITK